MCGFTSIEVLYYKIRFEDDNCSRRSIRSLKWLEFSVET